VLVIADLARSLLHTVVYIALTLAGVLWLGGVL
jgi:hypothetical protein